MDFIPFLRMEEKLSIARQDSDVLLLTEMEKIDIQNKTQTQASIRIGT